MDLAEFLAARLGEWEAGAWAVHDISKCDALLYEDLPADAPLPDAADCECGYPARMLRQVTAMRAILDMWNGTAEPAGRLADDWSDGYRDGEQAALKPILLAVAAIWSDHPDYDAAWNAG